MTMTNGAVVRDELDTRIDIETPEQIALSYSIAGIGSRGVAAAIDYLICIGSFVILIIAVATVLGQAMMHGVDALGLSGSWVFAFLILVQFVLVWGYYVVLEGMYDGQTPGKRVMQIRVVRDGGYSVTFSASAVRNLVRMVDMMPFPLYLVGIIASLTNKSGKRLGDLAAGTFVVKEGLATIHTARAKAASTASTASAANPVGTIRSVATQLTDDEYAVLEQFMLRRQELDPDRRKILAQRLTSRFAEHLRKIEGSTEAAALVKLFEQERDARATGVAARSDTGARREQHALVALGRPRWNSFAAAVAQARARGFRKMTGEEVSAFVEQYRELTTDLARLQTATRGRDSDAVFYVSRLVAGGHSLLYRAPGATTASIIRYLFAIVPTEVRRSWRPIALAALFLFGPAVAAYVTVVYDPSTATQLLPEEMLSRASMGAEREKQGKGYVTIDEKLQPIAASQIMTNNIRVAYGAFALGVTAGIGTILMLVLNGVSIGAAMGLFAVEGVARLLIAFVAPHGVLELSAICIAGGGGLLLATALLLPGKLTRREALIVNGGRAIDLIAGATLILIVAGTIEGLISPRVWPITWKLTVSGATTLFLIVYLSFGRYYDHNSARSLISK